MKNEIDISVIMASYNSEKEIERALQSIRNQEFKQERIEILVVDGGSTDRTREIAIQYGAIVLDNPYRIPEPAKLIGLKAARGKYVQIMDTDEEMCRRNILYSRFNILEKYKEVRCCSGGYSAPIGMKVGICSQYINQVGDPFTCFIYKTYRGGSMPGLIVRKGIYKPETNGYIAYFDKEDIRPIGDSVTMMERQFLFDHYSDIIEKGCTTAELYDRVVCDTGYTAFVKDDFNYHYSNSSLKTYIKKLKFRVINNVFDVRGSGYSAKASENKGLNRRKYLYPFYVLSMILPLIDGIRMAIVYKHPIFLLHIFFSWYVMLEIIWQYGKKLLGLKSSNTSYAR